MLAFLEFLSRRFPEIIFRGVLGMIVGGFAGALLGFKGDFATYVFVGLGALLGIGGVFADSLRIRTRRR